MKYENINLAQADLESHFDRSNAYVDQSLHDFIDPEDLQNKSPDGNPHILNLKVNSSTHFRSNNKIAESVSQGPKPPNRKS
jgi:hypothetical protein